MIATLVLLISCIHTNHDVVVPINHLVNCDEAQDTLLAVKVGKGAPTPTFSGRCRQDLQMINVPRPADVVAEIENNRGFLETCVVKKGLARYAASITVKVGYWDFGYNGTNDVTVNNSSLGEFYGTKFSGASIDTGSVAMCLVETLQRADFPPPRTAVKTDATTHNVVAGEEVPYTFVWHFNYPADIDIILDDPPILQIPQVFPGVGSEVDN